MMLSVVIPARDAATTIGEQLEALAGQQAPVDTEIVVVDNGSTDGTVAAVEARCATDPRIRLVHEPRPGAPAALTRGVDEARGELLAFCDADDVVAGGWLATAVQALADHQVVTGPLELARLNGPDVAASRGQAWAEHLELFAGVFPMVPSGNFAAHRHVFDDVGGFDESLRVGYDVDFAYRLFLAGYPVHFDDDLVLHYRYRPDATSQWRQGRAMGRFRPSLYRRMRADGHPVPSRLAGVRRWLWLLRSLPTLRNRTGRMRWVWVAANQWGHVEGSVAARALYL